MNNLLFRMASTAVSPFFALNANETGGKKFPRNFPRNILISLDSDEEIQDNQTAINGRFVARRPGAKKIQTEKEPKRLHPEAGGAAQLDAASPR
jgi:predicted ATPase